eukprot:2027741-Amphidinium_carterae.1
MEVPHSSKSSRRKYGSVAAKLSSLQRTGDNCQVGGSAEELQALQNDALAVDAATGRPQHQQAMRGGPKTYTASSKVPPM